MPYMMPHLQHLFRVFGEGFSGLVRGVSSEISPHFLCFFSSIGIASKMGNMKGNLFFKVGFVFRTWKARKKKGPEIKCAREK